MKRHLEPLAIASRVTQGCFCRLDEVLLTFGYLVMQYREMNDADMDDLEGTQPIINSIEQRWAKADQELFIASVIINPLYQSTPFAPLSFLNNAGIHALFAHLWKRFYCSDSIPDDFHPAITDYLAHKGIFLNLKATCLRVAVDAERKVIIKFRSQVQ
jgi:hypothetical protein